MCLPRKATESRYNSFLSKRSDIPDISVTSNREACITGIKGITEYTQDLIRLNCGNLLLTVKGKKLNMTALSVEEVIVNGEISVFEFSHNRR